jgi:hypothetical protein
MSIQRVIAWTSAAGVAAAVVAGLAVTGSPATQRLQRLDEQRVEDLGRLARAVNAHWALRRLLPGRLEDAVDGLNLRAAPLDPASGAPYDYGVTAPGKFELCASFSRPSARAAPGDFWYHEAGRACFAFDAPALPNR